VLRLSDIECNFLASVASKQPKPWNTLEETQELMWDSEYVVDSGSEFGDLSPEEEEMIDAGCDPVVESADTRYVFEITLYFQQKYMQKFLIMIFNV